MILPYMSLPSGAVLPLNVTLMFKVAGFVQLKL